MTESTTKHQNMGLVDGLRGFGQLAVQGVLSVTGVTESAHQSILSMGGLIGQTERTRGLVRAIYKSIYLTTSTTGATLDALLQAVSKYSDAELNSDQYDLFLSALNGVLGDHLAIDENPLAIPMLLRSCDERIDPSALQSFSSKRLVIFVHGLCMNEQGWMTGEVDYGAELSSIFSAQCVYLRYNTGLNISENGEQFSNLLQSVSDHLQDGVDITLVGHSMGGLVSRSAFEYAKQNEQDWPGRVDKFICLGSPHHGAPLERAGHGIDRILEFNPYSAPFAKIGKVRSRGICDLRHGNIIDSESSSFSSKQSENAKCHVSLPDGVESFALAARVSDKESCVHKTIGDGLVPVYSALGCHSDKRFQLEFDHQSIIENHNHIELLGSPSVLAQLIEWMD